MANKKKNKELKASAPLQGVNKTNYRTLLIWLCVSVIAIVTFIVFYPSLQNGFTNVDDDAYVLANPLVANDAVKIKEIFQTPVSLNYHPLTILSLAWNYQSGLLNPVGYHLENVVFHVLNTVLVFFFIFLLTRKNLLMAGIVSLFFGIHPMHVESVSWISERKDVLYVFFFISGLITYLFYHKSKKRTWYVLTLILFIASCLSKGMAVIFPLILLLIDYQQDIKWNTKIWVEKIPFFIVSVGFGIAAIVIQKTGGAMTDETGNGILQRTMIASYGFVMYVVKFFAPVHLAIMYPQIVDEKGHLPIIFYLSPFIVFTGLLAVYFLFMKTREVVFGLLFYLCSVALVLQFFSVGMTVMSDRYSYLSYIGLLFIVAYVINKAWHADSGVLMLLKYPLTGTIILAAVLFSYQTYARTQVWKNSQTLWADEISKYPNVPFNHLEHLMVKQALYYQTVKKNDLAMENWNCALMLVAGDTVALYNRANMRYQQTNYDSALSDYNRIIELGTCNASAYRNRALIFVQKKDFVNGEKDFTHAIKLDSGNISNYFNRGLYYNQTNQDEKALLDFKKCLQLNVKSDTIYNWHGVTNHKLKRYSEAITDFSKAIELNPKSGQYLLNRSFSENAMNHKEEAKKDAIAAQQLGINVDPNYLKFLGIN